MSPPFIPVWISTLAVMLTMAPPSAWMTSSASRATRARE